MKTQMLIKAGHVYLFRWNPGEETALLRALLAKARDPASGLDHFDAAIIAQQHPDLARLFPAVAFGMGLQVHK